MAKIADSTQGPEPPAALADGLPWPLPPLPWRPWLETWRHWRVALLVERERTAAAAGRLLHVSPSAVGRAVAGLEQALGLRLFERGSRGMVATEAASVVLPRIAQAFSQIEQAEQELQQMRPSGGLPPRLAGLGWRPWQAFVAVATTGSEAAAASALGISQSAVSQALQRLRHHAGLPLFSPGRRTLQLSEPGEVLLRRAKLAWLEFCLAAEDWAAHQGTLAGRLVVGTLPLSSGGLVPLAVDRLLASHSGVSVTVVDGTYDTLLRQLRHGEIDALVGALRSPPVAADVCQEPLFQDRLSVVARPRHPAMAGGPQRLATLARYEWIVPLAGTPWRAAFDRAFAAEGVVAPSAALSANSAAVVRALLLDTDRLALLSPSLVQRELARGELLRLDVPVQGTGRTIGVTRREGQAPSAVLRAWLEILREMASAMPA